MEADGAPYMSCPAGRLHLFTKYALDDPIVSDGNLNVTTRSMIGAVDSQTSLGGLFDEDAEVRHEQEYAHLLSEARHKANTDALTGVKNKNAYVTDESELNALIAGRKNPAFAVVVCDLNNLKTVNDTLGHKAGDTYIRKACSVLCGIFDHSPVFRVGGDEFVVICQGHDYEHIEELLEKLGAENAQSKKLGDVQIAFGMARFDGDKDVESVFTRADQLMYKHKAQLKA
jgi:diguanylate cyclase (GGDEF)-like protein